MLFLAVARLHIDRETLDNGRPVTVAVPASVDASVFRDLAAKSWREVGWAKDTSTSPPLLEVVNSELALKAVFPDGRTFELPASSWNARRDEVFRRVLGQSPDQRVTVARKKHVSNSDLKPTGTYATRIVPMMAVAQ